ncbi:MAG TPA: SusC/RagA family TonB-linked outer membrane protein [Porphyromonadaceae bacterium]|nr:SusC/RagA family TonB-linked outer membrane protein [Porphyromonadaceae bacterium]
MIFAGNITAQSIKEITGEVFEEDGVTPAIGANVMIKGTNVGTTTTIDGIFKLNAKSIDILVITYIGYEKQEITIGDNTLLKIVLKPDIELLEEVVVTAWGKEKKTTVVGSVATVRPKELKGPTSNLTTMLSGRVAGLISYQTSGEPGRDNATFFIRGVGSFGAGKVDPLILINGIESTTTELARIQPDDIEGFSVLKDATATSMYGTRGANGVILLSTKNGHSGKTKFNIRYESSISSNAKGYNLADNVTYMELANEASLTRGGERVYDFNKIEKTRVKANEYLYPNNNWKEIMIRDYTLNHRMNMNVSGGGDIAKYYLSASYRFDNGMLKTHKTNNFDTNIKNTSLEIRSNIDLNLTKTTIASVRINGLFDDLSGPATSSGVYTGSDVFKSMLKASPVAFPAVFPQNMQPWVKHPLFGNASMSGKNESNTIDLYYNPYANALSGYSEDNTSNFTVQAELNQDFGFITEGLKSRIMAYTKRSARSILSRSISPFYYMAQEDQENPNQIKDLMLLNEKSGTEWLGYAERGKEVWSENWIEGALIYDRIFNDVHSLGGTLVGYVREKKISNAGNLERSLPQRNVSLSGRLTYGYDNRYLGEVNFGYNASERFDAKHRWGFFPSIGLAWNMKEEKFAQNIDLLDKLKLRYSYGVVGNDELTDWFNYGDDRFFYLDMVNMNAGSMGFGPNYAPSKIYQLIAITRYGNSDITWEKSYKSNIALELGLFNGLNAEMDLFWDKRTNILQTRTDIPTTMGLRTNVRANIGQMKSHGFEATLDYNKNITKDLWASLRGSFTFARNKATVYEEPNYPSVIAYRSAVGLPWNTIRGYIAERLFIDDEDVANSPEQFGDYSAGDIKYRDVNGDGVIDTNDMLPMGFPSQPELNYGFGFSIGYKDFDFSSYFSGIGRVSFMIDPSTITPFVKSGGQVNGLLDIIAQDHWSEENRNPYAFFPRLSDSQITNNNRNSTWWLRDGSFLKLSSIELGYEPKGKWIKRKTGMDGFRIYLSGSNLFKISKFKIWDAELKGNGMGYPLQRVFNLGIQVSF